MSILFKNAILPDGDGRPVCVSVENKRIAAVSPSIDPRAGDEVIDCGFSILTSGFYNTHCHAPMTALRGFADDLPLDSWLNDRVFPAEDKMTPQIIYSASMLAIAEMLASGTVAFSDMYFGSEQVAKAVAETGIKANISRCLSLPEGTDLPSHPKFAEAVALISDFDGFDDGRIVGELSFHAEYTNGLSTVRSLASYAAEHGRALSFHACETPAEVEGCLSRHGEKPIPLFEKLGVFDAPRVYAAHCVAIDGRDRSILASHRAAVSHCPKSNLKLGSGIADLSAMEKAGVLLSLGTDGAASNNRLDMMSEMQAASLLQKGLHRDPSVFPAKSIRKIATRNGALVMGREDCGKIEPGARADLILVDVSSPRDLPGYDPDSTLVYSAASADVSLTMVDGRVLYRNGEYTTLDVEKIRFDASRLIKKHFRGA